MIRRIAASLAALAMLLILAVPVVAGGWAEIVADAQTTKPPVEGQPTEVGFKVMQHGVTPAPWVTATVHFVDMSTGETIDVTARNDNANGHFVASATLPRAGYWSWQVTLLDLVSEHVPVTLAVRAANGQMPALDSAATLTAIERAKTEVRSELATRFGAQIEELQVQADEYRSRIASLETQAKTIRKERTELSARLTAVESGGGGGLPIVGVISLAVLAGAAAGFAMSWLAGRPGPTPNVALSPAPRGADPA
jgi:hypothetical protein